MRQRSSPERDACLVVLERMRGAISSGRFVAGRFLPSVRQLSAKYGVAPETIRRGLKALEHDSLVVCEPRRGFRVTARPGDGVERRPIAYVTSHETGLAHAQPVNWAIHGALQRAMASGGSTVLGARTDDAGKEVILDQLKAGRAWGIALDTVDRALLEVLRKSNLLLVMVNNCWEDAEVDVVTQDNYRGGFLAAKHLLESGCRRIAWFGALGKHYQPALFTSPSDLSARPTVI